MTIVVKKPLAILAVLPSLAWAHPGHGATEPDSVQHYLLEPLHVVMIVAAIAAIGGAIAFWRSRRANSNE
jgi:hypothetical protein